MDPFRRIRTVTGDPEMVRLGVGLQMNYIGSPMIFAGEELGFQGRDGEDSRRPMRWDRRGTRTTGPCRCSRT
jgi:alpha-glucosidase